MGETAFEAGLVEVVHFEGFGWFGGGAGSEAMYFAMEWADCGWQCAAGLVHGGRQPEEPAWIRDLMDGSGEFDPDDGG